MMTAMILIIACALGVWTTFAFRPKPACGGCKAETKGPPPVVGSEKVKASGDPKDVVANFKRIYQARVRFRKDEMRMPTSLKELHFTSANWTNGRLNTDDFLNSGISKIIPKPDVEFYYYSYTAPRADGSRKSAVPASGERDLWLLCNQ